MDDIKTISELISKHTGGSRTFKQGLVYDDNPDVGDKIQITVIAVGFKMNLVGITGADLGKLIMIDKDFVYEPSSEVKGGEMVLPDVDITINKVGYSTTENVRKFHFEEKPDLLALPRTELEGVAAIRRSLRHQMK